MRAYCISLALLVRKEPNFFGYRMNRLAAMLTLVTTLSVYTATTARAEVHAVAAPSAKIEQLFKDSRSKSESKVGRNYTDQFLKAVDSALLPAMTACTKTTPDTVEPGMILFVIGADGRVKQLLFSKEVPMAQCVAVSANFRAR